MPSSDRVLVRFLAVVVVVTATSGFGSEVGYYLLGWPGEVATFFSLSDEANFPTWVSSSLLLACSLSLAAIARERAGSEVANRWRALASVFAFMSLDEAVEIHEHLGGFVDGRGVFYFSWVAPASVLVVLLFLFFLPLLRSVPPGVRRGFVIAGGVYVAGALGMELPLGYFTERHGDDNLGYAAIDAVEETLELVGAAYFLVTLERLRTSLRQEVAP